MFRSHKYGNDLFRSKSLYSIWTESSAEAWNIQVDLDWDQVEQMSQPNLTSTSVGSDKGISLNTRQPTKTFKAHSYNL